MNYLYGQGFISHRSYDYRKALELKHYLEYNNLCSKVILWENETLCRNFEQLTVHDYFEALSKLKSSMNHCDSFFYIDSPNYLNGYFTSAELTIWRWIKENPIVYRSVHTGDKFIFHGIQLDRMDKSTKHRLSYSSFLMKPDPAHDMEFGFSKDTWGKFAKECFLVGCSMCGEYYLIGYEKMRQYIDSQERAICPNCKSFHCTFSYHPSKNTYFSYRHPIIMHPTSSVRCDLTPLSVDDILVLLGAKKLPTRFKLDISPKDKLMSDNKKNLIFTLKYIATAVIAFGVGAITLTLSDKKK